MKGMNLRCKEVLSIIQMNAPGSPPNRPDSSSGSSTVSVPSSAALSGDEQVGHLVQIAVPTRIYIVSVAVPANLYSLGCCLNKFIQSRLLSQLVFIQFRLLFQLVFIQARLLSQPVVILVPNSFFLQSSKSIQSRLLSQLS